MEPHGHHQLHPAEGADDGARSAGVVQEVVGNVQSGGGLPGGDGVLMLFHRREYRRQAVGLIGVFRRPGEQGGLALKALPLPQGEADIPSVRRDARTEQYAVRLVVGGPAQGQGRVSRQQDIRLCHAHGAQLIPGVRLPQSDGVHIGVQHLCRQLPVVFPGDGADAAAVHLDLAPGPLGGRDVVQIEPQRPAGGHILNKAAAAVDIELCPLHGPSPRRNVHPADGADPVGQAGASGVLGDDCDGHIRVDAPHLLQNGL